MKDFMVVAGVILSIIVALAVIADLIVRYPTAGG